MHCCENHTEMKNAKSHTDPICGMAVENPNPRLVAIHNGRKYYFCAEACMNEFNRHPERRLQDRNNPIPEKKGIWGRYLDRLTKVTGGKAMKCH